MMRPVHSACYTFLLLIGIGCRAQALRPVPASQVETLIKALPMDRLPVGAQHAEVDRKQIVGSDVLKILPVRYQVSQPGGGEAVLPGMPTIARAECGVFIQENGTSTFLPTLGLDGTEAETCNALLSIGAFRAGATHGELILIYDASSPNASPREPVILSWDESNHKYQVNEDLSQKASTGVKGTVTVAAVRRALSAMASASSHP